MCRGRRGQSRGQKRRYAVYLMRLGRCPHDLYLYTDKWGRVGRSEGIEAGKRSSWGGEGEMSGGGVPQIDIFFRHSLGKMLYDVLILMSTLYFTLSFHLQNLSI